MNTQPRLSVVIPWCNRNQLRTSLAGNEYWLGSNLVELIIINCGGTAQQLQENLARSGRFPIKRIEVPVPQFNKSLALNLGIFASTAQTIFVLDADIILRSNPLTDLLPLVNKETFLTLARVWESEPSVPSWKSSDAEAAAGNDFIKSVRETHIFEFDWADGTTTKITEYRSELCDDCRAGPGLIMVDRDHLLAIGGYNSNLELWGWEDNDVEVRLRRALSLKHADVGSGLHLTHGDDVRVLNGKDFRQSNWDNLAIVCKRYAQANFLGTYSSDVSQWWPRAIVFLEQQFSHRAEYLNGNL
jgi:glycosyltransferase involved in cell wall biosynthesis